MDKTIYNLYAVTEWGHSLLRNKFGILGKVIARFTKEEINLLLKKYPNHTVKLLKKNVN